MFKVDDRIIVIGFTIKTKKTYDEGFMDYELIVSEECKVYNVVNTNNVASFTCNLPTIIYENILDKEYVASINLSDL